MCKCFCFSATATSTLHCLMFPHPPPRDVFGPSVKFQDAKTGKKHHLPNDGFLINFFIEKWCFLSSERLPPLSAVPPTNKKTHPPISKPHPAKKIFFSTMLFSCATNCFCFSTTATSTLHCLMFPHPPPRDVFGPSVKFQDAKTEKKNHLPNDGFLIKILLKNDVFGAQKGYPPWARSPPQIKRRTPQLVNPTQPRRVFFHHSFLMCKCFVFVQIGLMFPHFNFSCPLMFFSILIHAK